MTGAPSAVTRLTGRAVAAVRPIGAGVFAADLADGTAVVAKRHAEPSAAAAEVASLRWLAEDPSPVRLPAVLGSDDTWVVMERVPDGRAGPRAAEEFGRALAALHRRGTPAFGAGPPGGPVDAWIGAARMRNEPGASWPSWYAGHRIRPYLRQAVTAGSFDRTAAAVLERVCDRIGDLAGPPEPPARLHGDLWAGNVLWAPDGVWLIDPAAHGGHRETDLAMLALFGCPHLDRILAAYDEAAPLAAGWRDRVPLHQLFPLLVHTVLFGGGYAGQTVAAARRALAG
ncbi:fructosamine kinase family protein [Actinophytocola sp.]|uniref:fructosamine kinase family protein n=1 Tax=Actinophytocola sp. TaxID=1872138 RepID=UPI002D7F5613|nr:fructosamine kinase family protein [Actinophytocola sp.]HET9143944.1 fructosamine kinase family protein [Actinophytocola sp.]